MAKQETNVIPCHYFDKCTPMPLLINNLIIRFIVITEASQHETFNNKHYNIIIQHMKSILFWAIHSSGQ